MVNATNLFTIHFHLKIAPTSSQVFVSNEIIVIMMMAYYKDDDGRDAYFE